VKTVKLNGITYEEKSKVLQQRFGEHWPFPPPAPSYRIDSVHNMGVLSIPRSWRGEGEPKLVAIMDSVLEQMQKNHIQNLVVDIRGNPGGNDNTPAFVMGHLTKDTIKYYKSIYYRQLSFDAFKKVISTDPNEPKFDFTADAKRFKRDKEGRYWLTDAEWQGALYHYPPQRNTPFTGRVFLLATGENISAGSSFAALFKGSGRATIIGEETGSDYNFVIGGTALPIILPNSGIMVRIPTLGTRYGFKEQVKGRGTIPDITIIPTIADIIEGRDKAMETVIELIRKKAE
jgi:C-terminal processing protease CtpA/Prc